MQNGQVVLVNCKLRRGAFSGERVFQLRMVDPDGDYIGIAPVDHCVDQERKSLSRDQPPSNAEIDGYIEAFLIANGGDEARIELPDGEAITVMADQVRYQKKLDRGSPYVPVGS